MTMWNDFLLLVERIPATFWGVVLGSFFSLGGVILSNRASERRLVKQFDHEREQKNKDREMALRRDVYLEAAEAVSAGLAAIGRFPNLAISSDQVTGEFLSKSPSISKVNVIATSETSQVLSYFMGELNRVMLMFWVKRNDLLSRKAAMTILERQIATFEKSRDAFLEQIKQCNIDGVSEQRKMDVLQQNFNFENNRVIDAANRNMGLAEELFHKQLAFSQECAFEANKLARLIIPILSAVRKELELPFDSVAYSNVLEEQVVKQNEAIKEAMEGLMAQSVKSQIDELVKQCGVDVPK